MIVELKKEERLRIVHLPPDSLLMVLDGGDMDEGKASEYFAELQNRMDTVASLRMLLINRSSM